jgi:soluble P-type ATPase
LDGTFKRKEQGMVFDIPGRAPVDIRHVVLDYNGTIALDGQLIGGVDRIINELAGDLQFHVITADTYGTVENELVHVTCKVVQIPEDDQDKGKLDYLLKLGKERTLCVGNGNNDKLMLKEAVIGIALIQDEGVCVEALCAADIACKSILDVFAYFKTPNRLKATLRN